MEIEKAIRTAMDYETKIRDIYRDAFERVSDPEGKRFLKMIGDDEQHHLDYLKHKLQLWQKTGQLSAEKLESSIPAKEIIQRETKKVQDMVNEMTDEGQKMFARFLEIEENHIAAVQAELDYITNTGYWFDFKEFDMEEL
ncbi:MAG: hypothetical protein JRJ34_10810 [Deltaproteobacteria bacterium]|nr:hypothetical protein [Deltaproteobacteria bacterium]